MLDELMRNAPRVEAGEDLVNFYKTPGYWTWDPSAIVFVWFAIFFAMIMADEGYAALFSLRKHETDCKFG